MLYYCGVNPIICACPCRTPDISSCVLFSKVSNSMPFKASLLYTLTSAQTPLLTSLSLGPSSSSSLFSLLKPAFFSLFTPTGSSCGDQTCLIRCVIVGFYSVMFSAASTLGRKLLVLGPCSPLSPCLHSPITLHLQVPFEIVF